MKAYAMDLRQRVLADCDAGLPTLAVARTYRVSPAWVRRLQQRRQAGEVAPRPPRHPPPAWAAHADALRAAVREQPDRTRGELKARLMLALSLTTLWRAPRALGLRRKKKWA